MTPQQWNSQGNRAMLALGEGDALLKGGFANAAKLVGWFGPWHCRKAQLAAGLETREWGTPRWRNAVRVALGLLPAEHEPVHIRINASSGNYWDPDLLKLTWGEVGARERGPAQKPN